MGSDKAVQARRESQVRAGRAPTTTAGGCAALLRCYAAPHCEPVLCTVYRVLRALYCCPQCLPPRQAGSAAQQSQMATVADMACVLQRPLLCWSGAAAADGRFVPRSVVVELVVELVLAARYRYEHTKARRRRQQLFIIVAYVL